MRTKTILTPLLLLLSAQIFAQNQNEAVYLKRSTNIEIDLVANNLNINEHHYSEKVFYRNFEKHARESIFYSDFDPVTDLEAVTLMPERSNAKKMKVSTIETKDIVQPGIFYGGYKRKDFVFPGLQEGAIGRLEYSKQINDAHLLTPFFFGDDIEVKTAEFSVTFPPSMTLRYKVFGTLKENVKFSQQETDRKIKYSWTLTDVPAYKEERDAPSRAFSAPHVVVYIDSYEVKGKKQRVLSDVSDLYHWYGGLVKNIPAAGQASDLKQTVAELTKNSASNVEKIRAIFQWVQRNIKYIAFEDGMAGFIPRAAPDVYTKRYGDCKDMANLLKYMINEAGIDAYLTWIGTRSKPYSYSDVPSAITDNHMICSVKIGDEFVFLDATNSYVSFGKPSSMIQGKEALIGLTDDQFRVVKVPVIDRLENQRWDTIHLSMESNGVRGKFTSLLKGYRKDDLEIHHLKAEINQDREYIRDFFHIGDNNIAIEKVDLKGLSNPNVPARAAFEFFQPGYYKSVGDRIYVNLNFDKNLPGEKIDINTRTQMVEKDYRYEDRQVTVFTIPENATVSFVPAEIKKQWDDFGITSTYTVQGNKIIAERIIYSNFLYLDRSKFEQWNQFLQTFNTINSQTTILSKKT